MVTLSLPKNLLPQPSVPVETLPPRRAAFYIDGFNVYHGILTLSAPHLKWLDWWKLASKLASSRNETLVKIVFCTASPKHKDETVQRRHASYVQALESTKVEVMSGYFSKSPIDCKKCRATWDGYSEKEGDVNLAISMIADAHNNSYDTAYLVTADGDQGPTLKHLKNSYGVPNKNFKDFVLVLPPNRSSRYLNVLVGRKNVVLLDKNIIGSSLFPDVVSITTASGEKRNIRRPAEYDPP